MTWADRDHAQANSRQREVNRDQQLMQTFATLADTLVAGFDVVDLLQTLVEACHDYLDATAAGILLADETGELELIASTSEASRLVEMMQLSADAGPCVECFRSGAMISVPDIRESPDTWRRFRDSAIEQGFASAFAIPMRLRETTIGTLNLLSDEVGALPDPDVVAAQAFADVATIGILQERTIRQSNLVQQQLQSALNSRIVIEQAKGVIAYTRGVPMEDAFAVIRAYARTHRESLVAVSAQIVERTIVL